MKPATLVASPRQIGSTPVAMGSRVPVCPAFFTFSSARTCRTTSKEVGPEGLSMTRTPSMNALHHGCREPRLPAFLLANLAQEPVDLVSLAHGLVEGEEDLRGDAQVDSRRHLTAHVALGGVQPLLRLLTLL